MAGKRASGSKQGLVRCDHCGEEYSTSYRHCPFCDEFEEYESEYEDTYESDGRPPSRAGGKRLAQTSRRGGGYRRTSPVWVISFVVSLLVILLAAWIVVDKFLPLIRRGEVSTVDPNTSQSADAGADVSEGDSPNADSTPALSDETPTLSDSPDVSDSGTDVSPAPDVSDAPVSVSPDSGGATGFSLSKSEFSFSDRYPDPVTLTATFTPSGASAALTWSSSDPEVAAVDSAGKVTRGAKSGTATITASLPSGVSHTCTVRNSVGSSTAATGSSYTVSNADFTLSRRGETYRLKVNGYTGSVTWSSSNTSLVTVSADGTCTAVGTGVGKCTITGTLENGTQVTSIARISIS